MAFQVVIATIWIRSYLPPQFWLYLFRRWNPKEQLPHNQPIHTSNEVNTHRFNLAVVCVETTFIGGSRQVWSWPPEPEQHDLHLGHYMPRISSVLNHCYQTHIYFSYFRVVLNSPRILNRNQKINNIET